MIKPYDGHHGKGVTTDIRNDEDLARAFERAQSMTDRVIVEKMVTGNDYRVLRGNQAAEAFIPGHRCGAQGFPRDYAVFVGTAAETRPP